MHHRERKEKLLNQHSIVVWITGLSGSGKTTLAEGLEKELLGRGYLAQILDGDLIRYGICADLGFSVAEREENNRRVAQLSRILMNCGIICINSFISPSRKIRHIAREIIGEENFFEVFMSTSLETCIKRDPKGLYKQALDGRIKGFTGIDAPYEIPKNPDLLIDTELMSVQEAINKCLEILLPRITRKEKVPPL
jgi:adenylylsulfate kinase